MSDTSGMPFPYNLFWRWPGVPTGPETGRAGLIQPILPGWSFGDVTVNEANSNAPDTEQRIVAQKSYGQQIGILLDAVAALAADPGREQARTKKALKAAQTLEDQVNAIKAQAIAARIERIEADLEVLRQKQDQTDFETAAARLQTYLKEHAVKAGARGKGRRS
jgi:hypothetical protein